MALQEDGSVMRWIGDERLVCAERAVKRKLDMIREAWLRGES